MRRLLIDTDPGVDDSMMLQLALLAPELRVEAVTTTFGNCGVDATTRNALVNLEVADRPDVPVARGAQKPLVRAYTESGADGPHGADGLGNAQWPAPLKRPESAPAAMLIVERIMASPQQMTLLATGPMTNLALALSLEPLIARNVRDVVIMGGAVERRHGDPTAEFNVRTDPEAARVVFHAGWPLTMVGLDVTMKMEMTAAHLEAIRRADTPVTNFISKIAPFYWDWCRRQYRKDAMYVHDLAALNYVLEPSLFATERLYVDVETRGELTSGQTVTEAPDSRGRPANAQVCRAVDGEKVIQKYLERIVS